MTETIEYQKPNYIYMPVLDAAFPDGEGKTPILQAVLAHRFRGHHLGIDVRAQLIHDLRIIVKRGYWIPYLCPICHQGAEDEGEWIQVLHPFEYIVRLQNGSYEFACALCGNNFAIEKLHDIS